VAGHYERIKRLYETGGIYFDIDVEVTKRFDDLLCEELEESPWPGQRRAVAKVDMIRQQCNRLENLLRDFLRFATMRDLDMTPGSLNDNIEAVLLLYKAQADRCGIHLKTYLDSSLPNMKLHSDSLQAALLNLVKNAMEAMPDGGELLVRTCTVPGGIAMEMIDTGSGMDEVTAMRMFEPFYSTKHGGSGLGLPTAEKSSRLTVDGSLFKAK
jgi:signal transduction histidine kinase